MATKIKSNDHCLAEGSAGVHDMFALHFQASCRRDEVLEEAAALQTQGRAREARARFRQAGRIQKHLESIGRTLPNKPP